MVQIFSPPPLFISTKLYEEPEFKGNIGQGPLKETFFAYGGWFEEPAAAVSAPASRITALAVLQAAILFLCGTETAALGDCASCTWRFVQVDMGWAFGECIGNTR